MKMFFLFMKEGSLHVSNLCEGSSMNSSVPKHLRRGRVQGYSIDSRVVQHKCTLVLGIKDHSCRIHSVQYIFICHFK